MKRKLFSAVCLLISVVFCLGAFAGCKDDTPKQDVLNTDSAYPIIKDEYIGNFKLDLMAPNYYTVDIDWKNNKFFQRMKELTGVDFNFNVFDYATYGAKKPLSLTTSDNMPDFYMKALFDKTEIIKYGNQGLIIPLEDLIDSYMPNLKALMNNDPKIAQIITAPDGHIYSLPSIGEKDSYDFVGLPWINKTWLDNLNLDMPTTPDEFRDVLRAFRDRDANGNGDEGDEIPMLISGDVELAFLFSFFGIDDENYFQIAKDGTLEFGPETDRFKAGLTFMSELYAEGLLLPNYESYTINQKWQEASEGDRVGFFIDYAAYAVVGYDNAANYVTLDTVKNSYFGKAQWYGSYNVTDGFFVVTKKCKYPEVLARWIDTMYSEEYSKWAVIGKEGEEWQWDDAEKSSWSFLIPASGRDEHMSKATIQGGGGMPYLMPSNDFYLKSSEQSVSDNQRQVNKMQAVGFDGFPKIFLKNAITIKQASVMYADINKYIEKVRKDVIKGATVDYAYRDYDKMKRTLNIDGYMSLYKQGYDIYLENA